jgi:hypothetical protein
MITAHKISIELQMKVGLHSLLGQLKMQFITRAQNGVVISKALTGYAEMSTREWGHTTGYSNNVLGIRGPGLGVFLPVAHCHADDTSCGAKMVSVPRPDGVTCVSVTSQKLGL